MKISERGQITIPKALRRRYGLSKDTEVEIAPTDEGLIIRKKTSSRHPVDEVVGILHRPSSTDEYLEDIRGR